MKIVQGYILALICVAIEALLAGPQRGHLSDTDEHWNIFKNRYNKTYASLDRERSARTAWRQNLLHIQSHNAAGSHSYTLTDNHLSDMTARQYLRKIVKLVATKLNEHDPPAIDPHHFTGDVPEELDWTKRGFRPRVPRQKHCGACYAFSVTYAMEARLLRLRGVLMPLSPQQVVDCSGPWGNYGCGGGSLRATLRYLQQRGSMAERDYPYSAYQSRCRWDRRHVVANLSSWTPLPRGDEGALLRAVALHGPVPVTLNAAPRTFQLYHTGVYDDAACSGEHVNHAVLVVGYTRDHWLLLNWWGATWGEEGYMRIRRGHNRCGVANFAVYLDSR